MTQSATAARLVYNTGFSLAATVLARAAHIILFIIVSRQAGPAEAGILTIGLSYLTIASRFSAWGLDQILIRDVARDLSASAKYLFNFLVLRSLLSVGVLALLLTLFIFRPYRLEVVVLVYLITLNVFPEGILNLSRSVFIAYERMEFVTLVGGLVGGLKLLFGVSALVLGYGIFGVALGLLIANVVAMIVSLSLVFRYFITWRWQGLDYQFWRRQLKIAASFVFIAGIYIVDNQLDTLLVSWQMKESEVGLYGAVVTLITGIQFFPQAYLEAVFPRLSSAFFSDANLLRHLYRQSYKYLLIMGLPITLGLIVLAKPILIWLFGPEFTPATMALQFLAFSVGLRFLGILHNKLLIVPNMQGLIARFLIIGLGLNLFLNLSLLPLIGLAGAALARLFSTLVVFGLTYIVVFKRIDAFDARSTWLRPLLSGGLMFAFLVFCQDWALWLLIVCSAIVYGVSLLTLGTFSRHEIALWLQVLKLDKLKRVS